jgi:TonB family protein
MFAQWTDQVQLGHRIGEAKMSQLDRKCLIASTSVHAALVLLLVVSPLIWVTQKHEELTMQVLTLIPSKLVDGPSSGGGSPTAKTMPRPAAAPASTPLVLAPPAPAPPKPQSVTPKQEKPTAPVETDAPKPRRRSGEPVPSEKKFEELSAVGEGKPAKRKVELSFARDTTRAKDSKETSAADARASAAAQARAIQARYASGVNSVLADLAHGVSSGTSVEVPGPGGEAFANYGQWLVAVYHRAWSPPNDLADDLATVTVQIVVLRNGKVDSFKVIKRTGHAALDRSVERLRTVDSIAPFPDGALEDRRTFIVDFNLRSKNS